MPTPETLRVIAEDLGISLPPQWLWSASETHTALRPVLEEFRRQKFDYLDPIEPGHTRRWIENGGRTAPSEALPPRGS